MANPSWNPKLVSENGILRPTMGKIIALPADPPPMRATVRLGVYEGDGTQTVDVEIPVLTSCSELIGVDMPVMVIFMGDTYTSGVVMGPAYWF